MPTLIETVSISVAGANSRSPFTIPVTVDIGTGNGSGSFMYSGTNPGTDNVSAVDTHLSLTSNTANTAWIASRQGTSSILPASSSWSLINSNTMYKSHVGSGGNFGVALSPVIPQGFGLGLPSGNSPTGIQIIFFELANNNNPQTGAIHTVQLYNNGAPVGTAKTVNYTIDEEPSGNFSSAYGKMVTWVGPTDLWGLSPAALAAIVPSTSFGYGITCYAPNVGSGYGQFLSIFYIILYYAATTSNAAPSGTLRVTPANNGPLIDSDIVTVATTNPQAGTYSWGTNMPPSVVAQPANYTVSFNGYHFTTLPYIPVLEGVTGGVFLYDNALPRFDFGGEIYPPTGGVPVTAAAALANSAVTLSGDNTAWTGLFSLAYTGNPPTGYYTMQYSGGQVVSGVDVTNMTITADDIAWFDSANGSIDLFTPSSGGDLQYPIQVAYMVMPDRAGITVTPASMPANGSSQTLNVNLPKPMSPEQQGLYGTGNSVNAPTASCTGGVTITTPPSPVLNGSGWLTGWTMKVHVPASSSSGSFQLTFGVTGVLTYLSGNSFVNNGAVTYISGATPLATIATTGNNYTAPTNFSFVVSGGRTGTAPNYTVTGSITLTAVIFSTDNGSFTTAPGSNSFFRIHSAAKTTIAAGALVSGPTPVAGGYHTTIALTTTSVYAWGTPLSLGYTATDSLSGLSVNYTDSNTYNNGNPAPPPPPGGGGGCFTGSVEIKAPEGFVAFEDFADATEPFEIVNETGTHRAELVVHENYAGWMVILDGDKLVTVDHAMKMLDGTYDRADEKYADLPHVWFEGTVYNLHVLSDDEQDKHYILFNGDVAHNFKLE
jgi:hypothetical protein